MLDSFRDVMADPHRNRFALRKDWQKPGTYRLWKSMKGRLEVLEQERPLFFQNIEFKTYVNKKAKTCDITAVVYFGNSGKRLLKWRLRSWSIEANGKKLTSPEASLEYFMNEGQKGWYNYPTLQNVPFKGWPISVDLCLTANTTMFHP